MSLPVTEELIRSVQVAGYCVTSIEHPRSNRWLLTLRDHAGVRIILIVQARVLVSAADVQDLDEVVRIRHMDRGILWVYGGRFSSEADLTRRELGATNLELCTSLPPAASHDPRSTSCAIDRSVRDDNDAQKEG